MRRLTTLLLTAALAATPIAAATGCGADDVNPEALAQAADATRSQGGVHMTMEAVVKVQGQEIALRSEGDADLRRKRMHMKTEGGAGIPSMEQVLVGTTMYLKMAGLEQAIGAEWAKVDLARVGDEMGIDFEQMMQMGSADPSKQLDYLRATGEFEEVGEEEIDGVSTTHYKGESDLRRYPDILPAAEREAARKSIERVIELSGSSRVPFEVWIDDEHLVRRQKMTTTQKKPVAMTMEIDMRFSDFGKRVDVDEPRDAKDMTDQATEGIGRTQSGG